MATKREVLDFISEFKGVAAGQLTDTAPLGLTSLAGQRFRTALKRKHGIAVPDGDFKSITVHDVLEHIDEIPVSPRISTREVTPVQQVGGSDDLGIGIDIEPVESFRTSVDPQSDPLFLSLFTPAEFGYCLLQSEPAQHFAARFCAKEALRKCGSSYSTLAFNQIEVLNDSEGRPYYHVPHLALPLTDVALSLSHTSSLAIAVAARRKVTGS